MPRISVDREQLVRLDERASMRPRRKCLGYKSSYLTRFWATFSFNEAEA